MTDRQLIKEYVFESAKEAFAFVRENDNRKDRIYSIPCNNNFLVREYSHNPLVYDPNWQPPVVAVMGDSLGEGVKGVFNPADGKTYDSKSEYYKAVKAKGLVIMGDDAPTKRAEPKKETINWEKAVAETLKTTPLKGKTK